MPRSYIWHTTTTVRFLRQHFGRLTLKEIAAELNIPVPKLRGLAYRQGIKKNWINE